MENIPKYSYYPLQYFLIWKKIIFENFNISENNIISVKLARGKSGEQPWTNWKVKFASKDANLVLGWVTLGDFVS